MNTQTNEWEAGAECNPGAGEAENGADCPMYGSGWNDKGEFTWGAAHNE